MMPRPMTPTVSDFFFRRPRVVVAILFLECDWRIEQRADARRRENLARDGAVAQDALRREKPGEHRRFRADASLVVAEDEPVMQVRGDDAQLRLQIEDVPAILAEDEHGGRSVLVAQRTIVVREQTD